MPASHVRQVLEAIARSPAGLTEERDAVALLDVHLAAVEDADAGHGLERLVQVRDAARQALDRTFKVRTTSMVARSHADALDTALGPLEHLIDQLLTAEQRERQAIARLDATPGLLEAVPPDAALAALLERVTDTERLLRSTEEVGRDSKAVAARRKAVAAALKPVQQQLAARQREEAERVEARRRASQQEAVRLKAAMAEVTAQDPVDLARLRELVKAESERASALETELKLAAQLQLPIAPPPAKVAFADNTNPEAAAWTDTICAKAFAKYTWFEFKDLRKSGQPVVIDGLAAQTVITDDVMWKLYQYRRSVIDQLIVTLQAEFKNQLMFKSSGSEDIESDLDITVASVTPGDDVKAMTRFNAEIKRRFGRPPGRVFDTNLYARDYRAIEDNMSPRRAQVPKDRDIDQPIDEMAKMSGIDQDVATLMKQRRFLDGPTFTAMWQDLLKGIRDPQDRQRIQQRFEEAEAAYLLTAQEKVERIRTQVEARRLAVLARAKQGGAKISAEETAAFKAYDQLKKRYELAREAHDLPAVQQLLPDLLDLLEMQFPDEVMEATDAQYAERMAALRADQARLAALVKQHPEEGPGCAKAHPDQTHAQWLDGLNALKARIKQAQFTHIMFANEAYMSEGAITHIVAGAQAASAEKKQAVLKQIQPAELLQSTNEQLADFFKDMKHMAHAEYEASGATAKRRATGEAFVHASKYLSRMLDGAAMLQEKYAADPVVQPLLEGQPYTLCQRAGVAGPRALQEQVDKQLVKLRKSATIPGDAKAELAVAEVQQMFQVSSVAELRTLIMGFSREFNERVRQLPSFRAAQQVDRETERAYFRPTTAKPA
jgi:hypothetical protein